MIPPNIMHAYIHPPRTHPFLLVYFPFPKYPCNNQYIHFTIHLRTKKQKQNKTKRSLVKRKKKAEKRKRKNSYSKVMHVSNHSTTQTNHDIVVAADCLPGGIWF
ncbi:hypothetical protein EYC80_009129 [Monilinia laxa]|uniref:Uncharacterized protein n=1 Tax=Monilinia laxa TaxID=61186 RepID=A0A5N6K2M7_MONLA|nr:hypothetical protein EYC80_009129 [Monilinia laxa]